MGSRSDVDVHVENREAARRFGTYVAGLCVLTCAAVVCKPGYLIQTVQAVELVPKLLGQALG